MADHRLLGLPPMWALGLGAQAMRRLSPEWRLMSRAARRDEILAYVEEAKESGIGDSDAQAKAIAELFLNEMPTQWPYWIAKSEEESRDGWFAWMVVHTIVRRLWLEDRERVTVPPLDDWVSRFFDNPAPPSQKTGQPKGGRAFVHRLATMGVYALVDAGLCDVIGTEKGDGASACGLVAHRLDMQPGTVYNVWRKHRNDLAAQVDALISTTVERESYPDEVRVACRVVAKRASLDADTVEKAWRES